MAIQGPVEGGAAVAEDVVDLREGECHCGRATAVSCFLGGSVLSHGSLVSR